MAKPTGLAEEQRRALDRLSGRNEIAGYYLAGGSAIALHLGHRLSRDLDFFSLRSDADLTLVERGASQVFDHCEVISRSDAAVQLLCDGALIDFVRYPYPLLDPPIPQAGVALAGLRDLAVMKLAAIARRGIRRDFWDLYAILRAGPHALAELGAAYRRRFGVRETDLYHVLKALTYFDDAERDPAMPAGMTEARWQEIKAYFRAEAPALVDGAS